MKTGQAILVLGSTGSGKSSSLRNLEPKDTIILTKEFKPLPFPGWKNKWNVSTMEKYDKNKGYIKVCNSFTELIEFVEKLGELPFKNIVIDDFQFFTQSSVFERVYDKGFDKWVELGSNIFISLKSLIALTYTKGKNIILINHSNTDTVTEARGTRVKTSSKFIDDTVTVESLFTNVIMALKRDEDYVFQTNSQIDGEFLKSPMGALPMYIDNDIQKVIELLDKYDNGEE